jgi:hypothetical protein
MATAQAAVRPHRDQVEHPGPALGKAAAGMDTEDLGVFPCIHSLSTPSAAAARPKQSNGLALSTKSKF